MTWEYTIRKAEIKDAKGIHEVILAAFEQYRYFYSPEGFADTVMSEKIAVERIKDMTIFIAVNQNGEIIGTIGWKRVNREEGHIRGMAVHPNYQGKESPATDLLKMVEKDARSQGCSFLTLDTTEVLERAQNFYRKNGFTKTDKTGDFFGATIFEFKKILSDE
ncbi:MAG: GNAT family N-acetyltransferase [Promethearchaeota archaeon]